MLKNTSVKKGFLVDPDPKAKHNNLLESLDDDQYVCRISRAYTKYAKISLPVGKLQVPKHSINLTSVANLTHTFSTFTRIWLDWNHNEHLKTTSDWFPWIITLRNNHRVVIIESWQFDHNVWQPFRSFHPIILRKMWQIILVTSR